ncbi:MAG: hypothetical protein IPJ17_16865 [Holophagales bacterium]|nr:MAG: hypothetical protein IPJ17_16865 [Holophagales bacterium]
MSRRTQPGLSLALLAALVLSLALGTSASLRADFPADYPNDCRSTVDDPPPAGGPRDHHVAMATSADGLTFLGTGRPPLAAASVPDGIERPDGETWVYFVSGEPGRHGIHIARLSGDGDLVPFDCVRLDGAFDGHAVDPDIVRLPDGRYRLFFKGDFGLEPSPAHPSIESAVGSDGIHFTREGAALDGGVAADPTVARLADGTWLMAVPRTSSVQLARSADGRHFTTLAASIPLAGIPELWVTGDTVHLLAGAASLRQLVSQDAGETWQEGPALHVELDAQHGTGSPSMSGAPGHWRLFVIQLPAPTPGESHCEPTENVLCLGGGRFRATVHWADGHGGQGAGHARSLGPESGFFWFFTPGNAEILVKVLDGCSLTQSYWAFAAGLTDLDVELRVEDLVGDRVWTRHNLPGHPFPPAVDLHAFATCGAAAP